MLTYLSLGGLYQLLTYLVGFSFGASCDLQAVIFTSGALTLFNIFVYQNHSFHFCMCFVDEFSVAVHKIMLYSIKRKQLKAKDNHKKINRAVKIFKSVSEGSNVSIN